VMRYKVPEPCLCGDPECRNCFPGGYEEDDVEPSDDERRESVEELENGSKKKES
jgi:hypothetical protein